MNHPLHVPYAEVCDAVINFQAALDELEEVEKSAVTFDKGSEVVVEIDDAKIERAIHKVEVMNARVTCASRRFMRAFRIYKRPAIIETRMAIGEVEHQL